MKQHFEIILFNNDSRVFTDGLVNTIFTNSPHDYFSYVLCKEHCTINESGHEIKNLDLFTGLGSNRNIKDCIIIDNSIYCFQKHLTNGLHIPKYENHSKDNWLELLKNYLIEKIVEPDVDDVRKVIAADFNFEAIVGNSRTSQIKQMMNKHIVFEELEQQQ